MPDASLFDALLNQVRNLTISISFLHLTSKPKETVESPSLSPAESPPDTPRHQSSKDQRSFVAACDYKPPSHFPPLARHALRNLARLPHTVDSREEVNSNLFADNCESNVLSSQQILQLREESMYRQNIFKQKEVAELLENDYKRENRKRTSVCYIEESSDDEDDSYGDYSHDGPSVDRYKNQYWTMHPNDEPFDENYLENSSVENSVERVKSFQIAKFSNSEDSDLDESVAGLELLSANHTDDEMLFEESLASERFEKDLFDINKKSELLKTSTSKRNELSTDDNTLFPLKFAQVSEDEIITMMINRRRNEYQLDNSRSVTSSASSCDHGGRSNGTKYPKESNEYNPQEASHVDYYSDLCNRILPALSSHLFSSSRLQGLALRSIEDKSTRRQINNSQAVPSEPDDIPLLPEDPLSSRWGVSASPASPDNPWVDISNEHYGLVPYTDLLRFLSSSTGGVYMDTMPQIVRDVSPSMNYLRFIR